MLLPRRRSVFEMLARNGGRGSGTKGGREGADGVGVATGNGGGDMQREGVLVRDFAEDMDLVGVEGEGEEGFGVDERGLPKDVERLSDGSDEYMKMQSDRAEFYAALL